ncbi:auxin efflux carrier [Lipomyces arxii]|uniref:auxin efflux carrier n=1 Tax=Lipomyces arxii TaxID=56418 RepID=UPI0034CD2AA5
MAHNHPSYVRLAFLTFQAVVQVVFVCVLGFWAARERLLNPGLQKHISQLNVQIFTPCLIFVKLASSITADKLADLAIIPVLFVVTTAVSFGSAAVITRFQGFNRRESNFVTAMAVFGNSNSLPVSLTVALARTLPSLTWMQNDTPDSIASRGILYLLIFQQLGQMLRWSWGYNTLLSREGPAEVESSSSSLLSQGQDDEEEAAHMISINLDPDDSVESIPLYSKHLFPHDYPDLGRFTGSSSSSPPSSALYRPVSATRSFNRNFRKDWHRTCSSQFMLGLRRVLFKMNSYMNPPLYAMVSALTIASIRPLQRLIFETPSSFISNTFTAAITQTSQVAVPLILVVLGGNLYPDDLAAPPSPNFKRLVMSSLISRMFLPAIILLPVLALFAKSVHISIIDDPIFLVVLFLLTTAPPAIQLSQICQLNEVFEREMAAVLFWGYVVLTLPITMIMVVMSLEVLEWAGRLPDIPV